MRNVTKSGSKTPTKAGGRRRPSGAPCRAAARGHPCVKSFCLVKGRTRLCGLGAPPQIKPLAEPGSGTPHLAVPGSFPGKLVCAPAFRPSLAGGRLRFPAFAQYPKLRYVPGAHTPMTAAAKRAGGREYAPYVSEPQWGEIGRDIRAARDTLERQEKQQTLNIDEIKAQLKAQQSAQDQALNEIWRRIGRPDGANNNDLITKDVAGLCINEATIARKVWNGYRRHGDARRMDP